MKRLTIDLSDSDRALLDAIVERKRTSIVNFVREAIRGAIEEPDLKTISNRLADIERAISELATATRAATRVPTFVEFRARAYAQQDKQRPDETETQYLARLAREYMRLYNVWPDPGKQPEFGALPREFNRAEFDRARFE